MLLSMFLWTLKVAGVIIFFPIVVLFLVFKFLRWLFVGNYFNKKRG